MFFIHKSKFVWVYRYNDSWFDTSGIFYDITFKPGWMNYSGVNWLMENLAIFWIFQHFKHLVLKVLNRHRL